MAVKDKMYKEVQLWKSSGKSKADFILDKEYSKAKYPKLARDLAQLLVALGLHT